MNKSLIRAMLAILAAGSLGACASIPKRAWANGEAMSSSRAYWEIMSGNNSFRAHRELQSSLDPRRSTTRKSRFRRSRSRALGGSGDGGWATAHRPPPTAHRS
jgi:hypothetical protein